jgi:hypothetical protein
MAVTSRQELKDYCFRALGYPLVEIDVTDAAADDRIDEALDFFREYYFDGADRFFMKHIVTQEDIDRGWIPIQDNIWGINNILPVSNSGNANGDIFSYEYQFRSSDMMRNLSSTNLVYFSQVMSYFSLVENMLNVQLQFRFNRNEGKLYIDTNWVNRLPVGTWLMVDCYAVMDPEVNTKFWNNRRFKEYAIALIKQQWSRAYSKYDNIQLPGGVTIKGKDMAEEAKAERQEIEDDVVNNQSPLGFSIG